MEILSKEFWGWGRGSISDPQERREKRAWKRDVQGLHGIVAGDSAICSRLAALILRLWPAGLRFGELRPPQFWGGVGLAIPGTSQARIRPKKV